MGAWPWPGLIVHQVATGDNSGMLEKLTTEGRNPASESIDRLSPLEIVKLMNREDASVPEAVGREADAIAQAVEVIADRLRQGGRLIYVGAGTSGRLGVLDASECPPTFNSDPRQVVGIIAGGDRALRTAVEGAEDHPELARADLAALHVGPQDCVVGIATSGRTPYVIAALEYAREHQAFAIGLACNRPSLLEPAADLMIVPVVGPEVISGSTRLKAGTATKLVLNMLTTGAMVLLGKTYGNLMVDLRATNHKLKLRTNRIVRELTGVTEAEANELLAACDGELKTAILSRLGDVTPDAARQLLDQTNGRLTDALHRTSRPTPSSSDKRP